MITLYDKLETDFQHNGIGSLDQNIIDPKIHWIDNGVFSFEFEYPLFAKHGLEITNSSIIKARDPEQDNLFFVYKVVPSMGYIKVYAYQMFYKLAFNTINDTNIVNKNGQGALTQMSGATQYPHKFKFTSDIASNANSRVVRKNPVEFLLDSNLDNSFVNRWGGHIIRHGFNISMDQAYGSNKGYKVQHKKDLLGYEATIDETTVVTRIRPVGYDGLLLPEIYIDSPLINNYPEPRIQEYEYSDIKVGTGEGEFATAALAYAELRRLAKLEFSQNKIDVPRGVYKIDFVNLKETEEYKNFASLKQILPGDIVAVKHEEDGIDISAQMVEYNWNPLLKEYIDLTLGNYERSFTSTVSKLDKIQTDLKEINNQIELVYLSANGKTKTYISETEPVIDQNSTEGDMWIRTNGDKKELWFLRKINSELQWVVEISDATQEELKAEVSSAIEQADIDRAKAEQNIEVAKQTAKEYTDAQVIAFDTKFEAETGAIRNEVTAGYNNAITAGKTYTDNKSAEFNTQLDLVKADVASTVIKVDDAVTKSNKAITDAGFMRIDLDATKVTAIDALTKAQTATDNVNSLTTSYDALTQTVGFKAERTQVNAISGVVDQHELKISANAQAINARLTSAQVDSLISGKGYVNQSQLTATSSQWNLALTKVSTDLINLEIGTTNLLRNSGFSTNTSYWTGQLNHSTGLDTVNKPADNNSLRIVSTGSGGGGTGYVSSGIAGVYSAGEIFTVTFYARAISGNPNLHIEMNGGVGATNFLLSTSWVKYEAQLKYSTSNAFYFWLLGAGAILINSPKIERGNKASGWSPAPEDMATLEQFTTLDVKVNGIQMTVGDKADKTQVTQLATQWNQTTTLANGHTGQISNLGEQLNFRVEEVQNNLNNLEFGGTNLLLNTKTLSSGIEISGSISGTYKGLSIAKTISSISGYDTFVTTTNGIPTENTYTISFYAKASVNNTPIQNHFYNPNTTLSSKNSQGATVYASDGNSPLTITTEWKRYWITWTQAVPSTVKNIIIGRNNGATGVIVEIAGVKLEKGDKATDWSPAPEDTADKATLINQINLSTEGILLEGKVIQLDGDVRMLQAFIDRLDVQTLNVVTANVASIRTNILTADVITSVQLKVDNAMMDKLTANTAVVNYLFTKTAFVDNLNAKTLNAVTANIVTIRGQVLIANVVQATHLQADAATITKLFATDANVTILTGKSAFINSIKAVEITADKINGGTFNAALMNVVGLNANSMTTGTLNGSNMSLNLNTGTYESTQYQANEMGTQMKVSAVDISKGNLTTYSYLEPQRAVLSSGSLSLEVLAGSDPKSAKKITDINLTGAGISFSSYNSNEIITRSRLLEAISEGLVIRPTAGTGTDLNTSLHLKGGGTGSYQYIQFISGDNILQRLETVGTEMILHYGKGGNLHVRPYGGNDYEGRVISGQYETRHVSGNYLIIAADRIETPRDGSRDILISPNGTGIVKIANRDGGYYNIRASTFLNASSRKLKTNIVESSISALTILNKLKVVEYNLKSDLLIGLNHRQLGFIAEDSPSISSLDRESIDTYRLITTITKGVQELDQKVISIGSLATAANSIANNAMNKALQTNGEVQQMKNKIIELEKEIKTLKGVA